MAFDSIDLDGNGTLDMEELKDTMKAVAKQLSIAVPTDNDVYAVLYELDQNDDDQVDKDEFEYLLIKVLEKMAESELEMSNKIEILRHEPK